MLYRFKIFDHSYVVQFWRFFMPKDIINGWRLKAVFEGHEAVVVGVAAVAVKPRLFVVVVHLVKAVPDPALNPGPDALRKILIQFLRQ